MLEIKNYHFRYIKTALYGVVALLLVIMLIVLAVVNINFGSGQGYVENPSPTPSTPGEKTNKVKIQLVGDVVLNSTLLENNSNAYSEYDFSNIFSLINKKINGDISLFNLEGVIDVNKNGTQISGAPRFNYPKKIASDLKDAGFNMCVTANDRAAYFSDMGIKNNYENLINAGLCPVGTSVENTKNYVVVEMNGVKIGILAYTDKLSDFDKINTKYISTTDFSDIEGTVDKIASDVQSVKEYGAEIIIASMHWGDDISSEPTEEQRELADKIVKSGVDIIYGTRSHVFQNVSFKNIVDDNQISKNVVVAYSMGNFLAHPTVTTGQAGQQSAILNIYVERDQNGRAYISSAECEAIYIYAFSKKSEDVNYEYLILPVSEYVEATEKPSVFINDEDWQKCKDAYDYVSKIAQESGKTGLPLGLK